MHSIHFSDSELCCHHCKLNLCQQELLDALEALRISVGVPIHIDCAYRCAKHNKEVGGAFNSQHIQGLAADIRIAGMSAKEMYEAAIKIPEIKRGGIGVGPFQGYIHIDVRNKGLAVAEPKRWCYDHSGKECVWDTELLGNPRTVVC